MDSHYNTTPVQFELYQSTEQHSSRLSTFAHAVVKSKTRGNNKQLDTGENSSQIQSESTSTTPTTPTTRDSILSTNPSLSSELSGINPILLESVSSSDLLEDLNLRLLVLVTQFKAAEVTPIESPLAPSRPCSLKMSQSISGSPQLVEGELGSYGAWILSADDFKRRMSAAKLSRSQA